MNSLKTQVHTIFMLIGPSGSGKTTFVNQVLIPQLSKTTNAKKNYRPNIQHLSSDNIRREILGLGYGKFDSVMTESSEQAFDLLFAKLILVTSYPINAEYVILDTTGLSDEFRNKVLEIGKANHYNVDAIIFDYKKMDEYTKNFKQEFQGQVTPKRVVVAQAKRMNTEVMRTIKRDLYRNITRVQSKDFVIENEDGTLTSNFTVNVFDDTRYESCILSNDYQWFTIGDVHGCIDELKELLVKLGFEIDGSTIKDTEHSKNIGLIFIGDLVDKSPAEKIEETIRFLHKNMDVFGDRFQFLLGNHENMVWRWITNDPTLERTEERVAEKLKWYGTTTILEQNDELKQMFFDICARMKGWVKVIGTNNRSFIATHAPCEKKFLEKMDKYAYRWQVKCTSRSKNKDKNIDELTPYLMTEAVNNHPVHIFAHLGQSSIRTYKNKVCIDTGCVYGGSLTAYQVTNNQPIIRSVKSKNGQFISNDFASTLFGFEKRQEMNAVDISSLDEHSQKRLNYIVENGIAYIGGTISPAGKDVETGEFESLKSGLDTFKGHVDRVILEPKYMGSRCQMYLNLDLSKCYATSRNGFKIKTVDLTEVFKAELEKHRASMEEDGIVEIVLDGELMPWAAIGDGLIDKQFRVIDHAVKAEIDFLKENGFDEAFGVLVDQWQATDYERDKATLNKKDLAAKYGHNHNNFKYVRDESERWQPIGVHEKAWETYTKQVELYGSKGDIHYKAFRILKWVTEDGVTEVPTLDMEEQFKTINTDSYHIVDFNDPDHLEKANAWFAWLTTVEKMEGCVIKPVSLDFPKHIPPYMKVRNPDYLTIIYGYDMYFPRKFAKLFGQKNINRKVRASITEYNIGEKMLETDPETAEFKQIVANFLFENVKEMGIDPRL